MVASLYERKIFDRWARITRLTALDNHVFSETTKHLWKTRLASRFGQRLWTHISRYEAPARRDDHRIVWVNGIRVWVHDSKMSALTEIYSLVESLAPKKRGRPKKGQSE